MRSTTWRLIKYAVLPFFTSADRMGVRSGGIRTLGSSPANQSDAHPIARPWSDTLLAGTDCSRP